MTKERALLIERQELEGSVIFEKKGCLYCGGSGYSGRLPIFEVLRINQEFKNLIHEELNDEGLRKEMKRLKIPTMIDDAIFKMMEGLIDFSECYQTVSTI